MTLTIMDLRVDTTSEEVEGLRIVREICSNVIDPATLIEGVQKPILIF